jgi:hypothetical protein
LKHQQKLTFPKSPFLRTKLRKNIKRASLSNKELASDLQKIRPFTKKHPLELTVPVSPAITKPKPKKLLLSPPAKMIIKANPIPEFKNPFEPKIQHRTIPVAEFQLPGDKIRDQKLKQLKEKLELEQLELEKKKAFKAQPLPRSLDEPMVLFFTFYSKKNTASSKCRNETLD